MHWCVSRNDTAGVHVRAGHCSPVWDVQYSPQDRNTLCSVGQDGQLRMWDDRKPSNPIMNSMPQGVPLFCLAWSASADMIAAGGEGGEIFFFDPRNIDEPLQKWHGHADSIRQVAMLPGSTAWPLQAFAVHSPTNNSKRAAGGSLRSGPRCTCFALHGPRPHTPASSSLASGRRCGGTFVSNSPTMAARRRVGCGHVRRQPRRVCVRRLLCGRGIDGRWQAPAGVQAQSVRPLLASPYQPSVLCDLALDIVRFLASPRGLGVCSQGVCPAIFVAPCGTHATRGFLYMCEMRCSAISRLVSL